LDELMAIDWEQRDAPRKEYYCNDIAAPYAYGNGAGRRTYHPRPWPDVVKRIQAYLEGLLTTRLEVCFLNRYDTNRDHLGWHADDSPEMDNARPIVVVSFGSERVIQVRRIAEPTVVESLDLGPGSVFVMHPGMQQTHQHRIPKAGKVVGPRISLTFRGYLGGGAAHREGS
jgi:alkylated DNA repair dioxygenase AlkB